MSALIEKQIERVQHNGFDVCIGLLRADPGGRFAVEWVMHADDQRQAGPHDASYADVGAAVEAVKKYLGSDSRPQEDAVTWV